MKPILVVTFMLCSICGLSQKLLRGVVLDSNRNSPIPNASIFLSNTSLGTRADDEGHFNITIPQGKYDLVVSSIGYNTYSVSVSSTDTLFFLSVHLSPRVEEMETVVIEPWLKDGWERYGKIFIDFFIGTGSEANNCSIQNPEVIRFRYSSKTKKLVAMATSPIIVENRSLGYRLEYQLESFEYNYDTHYLIYLGYPLFVPMEGSDAKKKHWEKNRSSAYYGSVMHFMRSVYRNKIQEEGFEVRRLVRVPNTERERVKSLHRGNYFTINKATGASATLPDRPDSSRYYEKIMKQPAFFDMMGNELLTGDSVAYAITEQRAGMYFPNYLLVIYTLKPTPLEYRNAFPDESHARMSRITLMHGRPLEIEANGNYYDPGELVTFGFWAWSEKISRMLPLDYEP